MEDDRNLFHCHNDSTVHSSFMPELLYEICLRKRNADKALLKHELFLDIGGFLRATWYGLI